MDFKLTDIILLSLNSVQMISRLMISSNRFDQDVSYKSIYNSLESISKDKQEIQDKLDKHRRKAQKSLVKLEQHETSIL